jgi:hypothetical protein
MKKKTTARKHGSARKAAAKKVSTRKAQSRKPPAKASSEKTAAYTPKPIEGIGWAPFRYFPQ